MYLSVIYHPSIDFSTYYLSTYLPTYLYLSIYHLQIIHLLIIVIIIYISNVWTYIRDHSTDGFKPIFLYLVTACRRPLALLYSAKKENKQSKSSEREISPIFSFSSYSCPCITCMHFRVSIPWMVLSVVTLNYDTSHFPQITSAT